MGNWLNPSVAITDGSKQSLDSGHLKVPGRLVSGAIAKVLMAGHQV